MMQDESQPESADKKLNSGDNSKLEQKAETPQPQLSRLEKQIRLCCAVFGIGSINHGRH